MVKEDNSMPVPKRKRSRARRDKRFANKGMEVSSVGACNNCQSPIVPHIVCSSCGFFKGRKVLTTKADRAVKRVEKKAVVKARKSTQSATGQSDSEKN
jgi:large subunit ribosomal protein L32